MPAVAVVTALLVSGCGGGASVQGSRSSSSSSGAHPLVDIGSGLRGNFANYTDSENQNIANLVPIQGDIPGARL